MRFYCYICVLYCERAGKEAKGRWVAKEWERKRKRWKKWEKDEKKKEKKKKEEGKNRKEERAK